MNQSLSILVPVYNNADTIPLLVSRLASFEKEVDGHYEVIFVIDGATDGSMLTLESELGKSHFKSTILVHSRNFGSFQAIRSGLLASTGDLVLVMSADLQEPVDLFVAMLRGLASGDCDVAIATRASREDPILSRWSSSAFWAVYRAFVNSEMPRKGMDVFGCTKAFSEALVSLPESRSSLVGLIYWLGYSRKEYPYDRLERAGSGKSAWSFGKKLQYLGDSVFSFTNLPVRALLFLGAALLFGSVLFGSFIVVERLTGGISEPGYASVVLLVLITNALNMTGLGIVGAYAWRAYENTKQRPLSIVKEQKEF
jgi:glycosyltransferase involved in cell wall biosynthesis